MTSLQSAKSAKDRKSEIIMAGELILIVEDNEKNRKLVRDVLQVKGYQTIESETAEEGISRAGQISCAHPNGYPAPGDRRNYGLKQLRADPKTKDIPVIAITASAMTHNRQTMLAEGFDGLQTKPISLKDFLDEVERVLDAKKLE